MSSFVIGRPLLVAALVVLGAPVAFAQGKTATAKDIVDTAAGSPDHTTLVTAVKAADLVVSLKNAGPFTVFAPTNAAFDKLPKGTVEGLLKPEKKDDLAKILQYHVTTSALQLKWLKDGEVLGMANGGKTTIKVAKDGKVTINGANVVASIPTTNGMIHVIDAVLLPPPPAPKK
ncbi:MAG: fasciclin domain-containing protein [Deltaproteobacteria bacterium]|nr:fasciclin domain-containing protein [Deltaproteobacteria bacterium]